MKTQRTTVRPLLITFSLALLGIVAALLLLRDQDVQPQQTEPSATAAVADESGRSALRYRFSWQQQQQLKLGEVATSAHIDLAGEALIELDLTSTPRQLRIAITSLQRDGYRVDDTALSTRGLVDQVQVFELDAQGSLVALPEAAATATAEQRMAHSLLSSGLVEALMTGPGEAAGEQRPSPLGQLHEHCRRDAAELHCQAERLGDTRGLAGTDPAQVTFAGQRVSSMDKSGAVSRFQSEFTANTHADAPVSLQWRDQQQWQLLELADAEELARLGKPLPPGPANPLAAKAELDRKLDLGQADGLSGARVLSGLQLYAADEKARPERRWIWQSAAVLRLEPDLADSLGTLASRPTTQPKARALVIDLLSQVGHPQAQQALVAALTSPAVRQDPAHALLLQRLGFVANPQPTTVALARSLRSDKNAAVRDGATRALGALAGHLGQQASPDEVARGQQIVDELQAELEQNPDADQRAHLIAALGNAGALASLPLLLRHSHDDDAQVRGAAATSLRDRLDQRSRGRLLQLVADPKIMVQRAALRALERHNLDQDEQLGLAALVRNQRVDPVNYAMLVSTVGRVTTGPARREVLQTLLRVANDDPRLRGRIRAMLRAE